MRLRTQLRLMRYGFAISLALASMALVLCIYILRHPALPDTSDLDNQISILSSRVIDAESAVDSMKPEVQSAQSDGERAVTMAASAQSDAKVACAHVNAFCIGI